VVKIVGQSSQSQEEKFIEGKTFLAMSAVYEVRRGMVDYKADLNLKL